MKAPIRSIPFAVVAVCLSACGGKTVDSGDFTSSISSQFRDRGVPLHDVSCPDGIKAEVGTRFNCSGVNPAGTKLIINGRITSVKGDRAQAHYVAAYGIAQGSKIAQQAKAALEHEVGQRAKDMTCPETVRIPTRPSVTCKLTTPDGTTFDVDVKVDQKGQLSARVAKQPSS